MLAENGVKKLRVGSYNNVLKQHRNIISELDVRLNSCRGKNN